MGKVLIGFIFGVLLTAGQVPDPVPDPSYAALDRAYAALKAKNYEEAIRGFEQAATLAPGRASIRMDLAYTLLKVGETEAARDQFAEAMRLFPGNAPADDQVALEYAFLCYETKQQVMARRVFDRLRKSGNSTASEAFENVDRPLREGIARWKQALELAPDNFSAHEELARLAEQRDQLDLSAEQYEAAWKLRPARRDLLVDLGRVWKEQGRVEDAHAALLAASHGTEPRVAEQARELLPPRYPYVYEFENALALDPSNDALRRELAYLHLEMGNKSAAEQQLHLLPDRPDPAPPPPDHNPPRPTSNNSKLLGEQSLEKGYLNDALKYLQAAHENDPMDFEVMLKLGWTYNILKDDRDAVHWFDLARHSPDAETATEASRAYGNLTPSLRRLRTTVWAFPTISTRWRDTFVYAQAKTELRLAFPIHPYLSLRFIGDSRGAVRMGANISPQNLSERSVIVGAGLAGPTWHGLMGWFEAGEALRYQIPHGQTGSALPDYRGGITYAKAVRGPGRLFAETNEDGVFISRFDNDTLAYSQNRTGRTFGENFQIYWNWNATVDAKGEYWANTVETGPGVRFRLNPLQFTVNFLRGAYLVNQSNPYRPNFNDVRIGVWYAFTR
ncbi:MAG: tetratricopeptide repeat protein [Acidobacteriia bacterium]|nr:tetratricopeptide repeat protein [Terriglobia bacterium]